MTLDVYRLAASAFRMNERTWQRHASPWSVWTRVATLPVLLLALFSHVWAGWWVAAAATGAVLIWSWWNPRLFPPPRRTDTWPARATFGERLWLCRHHRPVPDHHRIVPHVLTVVAAIGAVLGLAGAIAGAVWPAVLGGILAYFGKLWFCDRMVWLFDEMTAADPRLRERLDPGPGPLNGSAAGGR